MSKDNPDMSTSVIIMQQETKTKMCQYCGEEPAKVRIPNPNGVFEGPPWDVCIVCEKVIKAQQKMTLGVLLSEKNPPGDSQIYGQKILKEAQEELEYLSKESGKPITSTVIRIRKKKELHSVKAAVTNKVCAECGSTMMAPGEKYCARCKFKQSQSTKKDDLIPTEVTRNTGLLRHAINYFRGFW